MICTEEVHKLELDIHTLLDLDILFYDGMVPDSIKCPQDMNTAQNLLMQFFDAKMQIICSLKRQTSALEDSWNNVDEFWVTSSIRA